jgi:hypothetical protein
MTISQTQLDQVLSEPEIKRFWLGYFQEGFREEIHQQLLSAYEAVKADSGFTRADLAKKIGRRPEQVTRWLAAPSNLEADTISDMALGLGMIPRVIFEPVQNIFAAGKPNVGNAVSDFVSNFHVQMVPEVMPANSNVSYTSPIAAAST